ncbi:MAG: FAD:protein FMN transferase, partial [Sarcina sp.]
KFSVFNKNSEVSNFNNTKGEPFKCSKDMMELLVKAKNYSKLTEGAFYITSEKLVRAWNIGKKNFELLEQIQVINLLKTINYENINLDEKNLIASKSENQKVSFGAIAKGYATDKVVDILKKYDIKSAVINLGGNIFMLGENNEGKHWNVGIQHPLKSTGESVGIIGVKSKSIVTLGSYERYSSLNGKMYSHIIDLKTGYPIENNLLSISIISNKSIDGDGLSTGLFILGEKRAFEIIESLEQIECVIILKNKEILLSSGLKNAFMIVDTNFVVK